MIPVEGEKVVPELPHTWLYCSMCGWAVKCGNCGNNCCNGGSREGCPDKCSQAYAIQDKWFDFDAEIQKANGDYQI